MKKCNDKFATMGGDIGIGAAADEFREFVREQVRDIIIGVMAAEVELLCGALHRPKAGGDFYRSGSAPEVRPASRLKVRQLKENNPTRVGVGGVKFWRA